MLSLRILQIIPVNNLFAVFRNKTECDTRPVICLELIEFLSQEYGIPQQKQKEMAVVSWKGRLTSVNEIPEFIGFSNDNTHEATYIFHQSKQAFPDKD